MRQAGSQTEGQEPSEDRERHTHEDRQEQGPRKRGQEPLEDHHEQ